MRDEHDDECSFYQFYVYDDLPAVVAAAAVLAVAFVLVLVLVLPFYILHKEINYF
jgi:hypothetical protein